MSSNSGHAYKAVSDVAKVVIENVQQLNQLLTEFFQKTWDGINANVVPALNQTLEKLGQIAASIYDELASISLNLLDRAVKQLKALEGDIGSVGKELKESLKVLYESVTKYIGIVRAEINDLLKTVTDTLREIPAVDAVKEKFQEVSINLPSLFHHVCIYNGCFLFRLQVFGGWIVPENIANLIRELSGNLKDFLPTPELQELLAKLIDYIENVSQDIKQWS